MSTIEQLHQQMREAHAKAITVPEGEESLVFSWAHDHLSDEGWRLAYEQMHEIRRKHSDLMESYAERELVLGLLEQLAVAERPPTLGEIADEFRKQAGQAGPWIVSTPIANAILDRGFVALGPRAALIRGHDQEQADPRPLQEGEDFDTTAMFELFDHLEDHLPRPVRSIDVAGGQKWDSGRLVALQTIEEGTAQAARTRARAKALYAIATWTILAPPRPRTVMPDLGLWAPQPTLRIPQRYREFQKGKWTGTGIVHGTEIHHFGHYELPGDDVLIAPFEAFAHLDKRPARALLSATGAAFQAARGSRLQLSERIRNLQGAIECLCEKAPGANADDARWEHAANHTSAWRHLAAARGFDGAEMKALKERLKIARNVSAHGADSVLVDFGWDPQNQPARTKVVTGQDLVYASLHRDYEALLFTVNNVLEAIWAAARSSQFDEATFEAFFTS